MKGFNRDLHGIRIDEQKFFSDQDNIYQEKLKEQRLKLLEKHSIFLSKFIKQGEQITMIAPARSPMSFGEFYFSGSFVYFQKRCVLIFTDQRILQLSLSLSGKVRSTIIEIDYGDIEQIKSGGLLNPTLVVKYRNGKQESFNYLKAGDLKKILAFIPGYFGRPPTQRKYRHNLCLRCTNPLEMDKYVCPHCRLEYKNPRQMLRYALIFPGGGFFYTGQYLFAAQYLLAEGVLLFFMIFMLIGSLHGEQFWGGVISAGIFLIFVKAVHVFHGLRRIKEYIPKQNAARSA